MGELACEKENDSSKVLRGIEKQELPTIQKNGITIKVLAGKVEEIEGPVRDLAVDVEYFDVELAAGKIFEHAVEENRKVFAYVVNGSIDVQYKSIESWHCAVFGKGDAVRIGTKGGGHFLFVTGEPLKEPVAWGGPIVMNTEDELAKAFQELDEGTFIKSVKRTSPKKRVGS